MTKKKPIRRTPEYFENEVFELTNDEYVPTSPFVKIHEKVSMLHRSCGNVYEVTPDKFLRGRRCPRCANEARRGTTEEFTKKVDTLTDGEYVVKGEYEGALKKIPMLHTFCGNMYEVRPNEFLTGSRCPNCRLSKGEKAVQDSLDFLGIDYIREHSFNSLGKYRYDFYLPSERIAIEYDGRQHFEAVSYFGGEEALERIRQSDAIKTAFCEHENIDLLRIPYTEFDRVSELVEGFVEDTRTFNALFAPNNEEEAVL